MLESIPAVVEVLAKTSSSSGGGVAAAFLIFFIILAFIVVFYVLAAWLLYRIGKKVRYDKCWLAWVPIANLYMMVDLSNRETMSWFLIILLVNFVPCVGWIVSVVMMIMVWMDICEKFGKDSWLAILYIIPIANFVMMYIIGSGEPREFWQPQRAFAAAPGYPPQQGYAPPPPQGYAPPPPQGYAPPPPQGYAPPPPQGYAPPPPQGYAPPPQPPAAQPPAAQPPAAPPPPPPPAGTPPAPGGE